MEDSAKGLYITLGVIFIFILCITQFTTQFPLDQGVNFSSMDGEQSSQYLTMANLDTNPSNTLETSNNLSQTGFDQWDVTQGFMGSNSIKQASQGSFTSQVSMIFNNLKSMATSLFGANSPVLVVLGLLLTMGLGYIIYVIIKFVRTGN